MPPHGVTRPQWVKILGFAIIKLYQQDWLIVILPVWFTYGNLIQKYVSSIFSFSPKNW